MVIAVTVGASSATTRELDACSVWKSHHRVAEIARDAWAQVYAGDLVQDGFVIGQKNKDHLFRRAKRGTRHRHRAISTASTYIFGAICPARGTCAALALSKKYSTTTPCTRRRSAGPSSRSAHMPSSCWTSGLATHPRNSSAIDCPLPRSPKSPELNPQENARRIPATMSLQVQPPVPDGRPHRRSLLRCSGNKLIDQARQSCQLGLRQRVRLSDCHRGLGWRDGVISLPGEETSLAGRRWAAVFCDLTATAWRVGQFRKPARDR